MGYDICSGLLSMSVCLPFFSTNAGRSAQQNLYFYRFLCHHRLITQLTHNHCIFWFIILLSIGIAKGQTISKANYGFLNSSKKRTKLTILSKEDAQDSEFCLFFWKNWAKKQIAAWCYYSGSFNILSFCKTSTNFWLMSCKNDCWYSVWILKNGKGMKIWIIIQKYYDPVVMLMTNWCLQVKSQAKEGRHV